MEAGSFYISDFRTIVQVIAIFFNFSRQTHYRLKIVPKQAVRAYLGKAHTSLLLYVRLLAERTMFLAVGVVLADRRRAATARAGEGEGEPAAVFRPLALGHPLHSATRAAEVPTSATSLGERAGLAHVELGL